MAQYNNVIAQITTTSQDASFNGVNLLGRRHAEAGVQRNRQIDAQHHRHCADAGRTWPADADARASSFIDNASANAQLTALNAASTTLRAVASSLGSNLSIVQIRQSFSKDLINVLQTGSSNLTLADTNEEAANSQALSTRQSIAVSALALANQSQQSVLKLLQ